MKKKKMKWVRPIKFIAFVCFVICAIIIAFYPWKDADVHAFFQESNQKIEIEIPFSEIQGIENSDLAEYIVCVPEIGIELPKEIYFTHEWTSVSLKKIQGNEVKEVVELVDKDHLRFNANGVEIIRELAGTRLMERIVFCEWCLSAFMLVWIIIVLLEEKFTPGNQGNHGPIYETKRFINDVKKYRQYIIYSAKANLKAEVANSYLNRLWWLLEPFFNMMVYVVIFGQILGRSIENYATFIFSSLLMWGYFDKTIMYSVKCIRSNRDIVSRVYVPKYVLLLSNMVLNFYKLLFSMIILIPMLFIYRTEIGLAIWGIVPSYAMMILLSFGVGMIFLHYGVYVDDLSYAVGILLQMTMFLSGIFYDVTTTLKYPLNVVFLGMNPVAVFLDSMRNALLYNKITNLPILLVWIVLAFFITCVGVHIVYKNENAYVKVV